MTWHQWVGKPHKTGADPETEDGCDCLLMVVRVRESLSLPVPDKQWIDELIDLARQKRHAEIHWQIAPFLLPIESSKDGAFAIFDTQDHIGTAVMIENGLLHVDTTRGVRWLPSSALRKFSWFDWK